MTHTLVALLGTSPGTVTATYYALHAHNPEGLPDRVVIVATDNRDTTEGIKMIRRKFSEPVCGEPPGPQVDEAIVEGVGDLNDANSTTLFQAKITEVLRQERDRSGNTVWLSLAGGRKSMAALAALAAQIVGVERMIHLYVIPELEQHGDINQLLLDSSWQTRCLHPDKGDYTLVEVPFFELAVDKGQLGLLLQGQPDAFVHEVVRAKPEILAKLPPDVVRAYWDYVAAKAPAPQYEDFTLHIGPDTTANDDFSIIAHGEGSADVRTTATALFTPSDVSYFIALANAYTHTADAIAFARALGNELFSSLFTGKLLQALWNKQGWADHEGRNVRLRLCFAPDARLETLPLRRVPWELMFDNETFLGLQRKFSIVRHLETSQPSGIIAVEGPLRVLIAAATPKNSLSLPEDFELNALYQGVQEFAVRLAVTGLHNPPRTFAALKHSLDTLRPHALYFAGHGTPGGLVFEDNQGKADIRPAGEVGALLADRGVRLVVLNACYSTQAAAPDLSSVAEALITAGVPAVVAMQSAIYTGQWEGAPAVCFAREFFYHLAAGWPVDACVTIARIKMEQTLPNSLQWALPVCFLRSGDGLLFAITGT